MKESGIGRENGLEAFEACRCRANLFSFLCSLASDRHAKQVHDYQHRYYARDARHARLVCGERGAKAVRLRTCRSMVIPRAANVLLYLIVRNIHDHMPK